MASQLGVDPTQVFGDNQSGPSLNPPWLLGSPPNWDSSLKTKVDGLVDLFKRREPSILPEIWAMAEGDLYRRVLLSTLQAILLQHLCSDRVTAKFDKFAAMVCLHIQVIVSTLDIRAAYAQWRREGQTEPPQWLKYILIGMDPKWRKALLSDLPKWAYLVSHSCSGVLDGTILYALWTRSDLYVGKANCRRTKGNKPYPWCVGS